MSCRNADAMANFLYSFLSFFFPLDFEFVFAPITFYVAGFLCTIQCHCEVHETRSISPNESNWANEVNNIYPNFSLTGSDENTRDVYLRFWGKPIEKVAKCEGKFFVVNKISQR